MAKVKMAHTIVTRKSASHSATDNSNTPYSSVRLLNGAPPGQVDLWKLNFLKVATTLVYLVFIDLMSHLSICSHTFLRSDEIPLL